MAAQVAMHSAMSGLRVAAPLFALSQGRSAFEAGLLFACFGISSIFLAIPSGRYADAHGLKSSMRVGVVMAVLGMALVAIWPHFFTLIVSCIAAGAAVGWAVVALQREVGHAAGDDATERKKAFSWLGMAPAMSNFFGPVLAGVVIDLAGFRAAFITMALMPLASWWLIASVREATRPAAPEGSATDRAWDLLAIPRFRTLLFLNCLLAAAWDVHAFMVPVLGHEFGFSAATIGLVVGSFAAAATAVRLVLPMVAEHLVEWRVIMWVMLLAGVLLALYPFAKHPVAMTVGSIALGLVLGAVQPMMLSTLHHITPQHRHGEALGLRMMVTNTSSVLMPLAFGAAGAALGAKAVFWAMASISAAGSPLAKGLRDR